jgi:hypothetical protein
MVFQATRSVAAYFHSPSAPLSVSLAISIFLIIFFSLCIATKEKIQKGGNAVKFDAFCLLIGKSPMDFSLLGGNKNTF